MKIYIFLRQKQRFVDVLPCSYYEFTGYVMVYPFVENPFSSVELSYLGNKLINTTLVH